MNIRRPNWPLATFAVAAALTFSTLAARAQAPDPAVTSVEAFDADLLKAMKHTADGNLGAAVEKTFNMPLMAQFAVGPAWSQWSAPERQALVTALNKYTTARFGHDFGAFSGQKFIVDPEPQVRGADKLVRTQVRSGDDAPDHIDYRMRLSEGAWKVVDVYFNGVSELTTLRADWASTLASGGASATVAKIDSATRLIK